MIKFNIGVTCIGYDSKELLTKALLPWIELKRYLPDNIEKLLISVSHGCFEETYKLGYPLLSKDGTHNYINSLKNDNLIDNAIIYNTPQKEYTMWTNNYLWMKDKIDLLIMLNADEIWEPKEIENMLKFIEFNYLCNYFKINFKNFCINERTWVNDFIVPRVWFTRVLGGLKGFYQDDLVEYENGIKDIQTNHLVIPTNLVFPKHYSWIGSKEYLQRKLNFQKLRYHTCSYTWDNEKDELCLNEDFYKQSGKTKPILNYV